MIFEAHITCHIRHAIVVEKLSKELHWNFSKIEGDPLLGAKPHCYLTSHAITFLELYGRMKAAVGVCSQEGVEVLREKIELIMYDTKTGTGISK